MYKLPFKMHMYQPRAKLQHVTTADKKSPAAYEVVSIMYGAGNRAFLRMAVQCTNIILIAIHYHYMC